MEIKKLKVSASDQQVPVSIPSLAGDIIAPSASCLIFTILSLAAAPQDEKMCINTSLKGEIYRPNW